MEVEREGSQQTLPAHSDLQCFQYFKYFLKLKEEKRGEGMRLGKDQGYPMDKPVVAQLPFEYASYSRSPFTCDDAAVGVGTAAYTILARFFDFATTSTSPI